MPSSPVRVIPVQSRDKYLEARPDGPVDHQLSLGRSRLATVIGFCYMTLTVCCSSWYLVIVSPYLVNDLWMPAFNSTGIQTYLGDVVHLRHNLGQTGTVDGASPQSTLFKDYAGPDTLLTLPYAAPRQALLDNIPFDGAIQVMRNVSLDTWFGYRIPYCWVDFAKQFELAHTAARQQRCAATDAANAAVVLEALLRNYLPNDIVTWDGFADLNALLLTSLPQVDAVAGPAWVRSILNRTSPLATIADEVAAWRSHRLTRFTLQLQTNFAPRLDDSILLIDALGTTHMFTINAIAPSSDDVVTYATFWASYNLLSDLAQAVSFNCSLVRGSPNDASALGLSWDTDIFFAGTQGFPGLDLLRANVGPLGSMDIRMIAVPPALATYFLSFRQVLYDYIQQDSNMQQTHAGLLEPVVDPAPAAWSNATYLFFGGSPLCPMQ
ncbi:hypothetical protein As57867_019769, partial [Aphanomyces stellatus]